MRPILEDAIWQTERRLKHFEGLHRMTSAEFVQRYEDDEFEESLDYADWIGEYRLLRRLKEKADTYREIQFVN